MATRKKKTANRASYKVQEKGTNWCRANPDEAATLPYACLVDRMLKEQVFKDTDNPDFHPKPSNVATFVKNAEIARRSPQTKGRASNGHEEVSSKLSAILRSLTALHEKIDQWDAV